MVNEQIERFGESGGDVEQPMLSVRELRKTFVAEEGVVEAAKGISFDVAHGEFFTLLGPSGCGKSTTLRCVAGLETIDEGEIRIDGEVVASRTSFVEANERSISMVFQSYAIWPHMSVLDNVTFPLSYRGPEGEQRMPRKERRERGMEALRLVQLDHLASRPAPYLSGGQQQRVALARALVVHPKLLLLDEPLSNLDAKLREEMRWEIKELTSSLRISTIYVTHDQGEALSMSDRIAVMSEGEIRQRGTPREIYLRPFSSEVARIVGSINVLEGEASPVGDSMFDVTTASGLALRCRIAPGREQPERSETVSVMFRPELVQVVPTAGFDPEPGDNVIPATVATVAFTGDHVQCSCETPDGRVSAKLPPDVEIEEGQDVLMLIRPVHCVVA